MSSEYKICNNYTHTKTLEWHTLFWIKSTSARSIEEFSAHKLDKEFVLLPGTKLKIINKTKNNANKLHIVKLEEILVSRESKYTA